MLLRNLNIKAGLCSGTRLILEDVINDQILKATIINREFRGKLVLMPKIVMQPADESLFGFEWKRMEFPVRVVFCMSIQK